MTKISCTIALFYLAVAGYAEEPKPAYLFESPAYPDMMEFRNLPSGFKALELPFVTVEKIYQVKDGKSLDPIEVIKFYREYFQKKGWKISEMGGAPEHSLRMAVSIYENLAEQAYIHATGDFYLLVAPKDGILLTFLRQWRISHPNQMTRNQVSTILARLDSLAQKNNYSKYKVQAGGPWERRYENEYLTSWELFCLSDNSAKGSDFYPEGHIDIELMTYRDAAIARLAEFALGTGPDESSAYRQKVRIGNIVIVIDSALRDRREFVEKLADGLRNEQ
jgi:hypothetical protein